MEHGVTNHLYSLEGFIFPKMEFHPSVPGTYQKIIINITNLTIITHLYVNRIEG